MMGNEAVLTQSISSSKSAIMDSNNRGNVGRDIIHNYGTGDFYQRKQYEQ